MRERKEELNFKIYIFMYHYVRPIKNSNYPNIKGLEYSEFKKQINFFKNSFNILSNESFVDILNNKYLPKKDSILLTFDDGYKDHFDYVYPYLVKKKISANFYPPINVIKKKEILNVNKIHFILEKNKNRDELIEFIHSHIGNKKITNKIQKIKLESRFDDKKTILIKVLLQKFLPQKVRDKITSLLFKYVVNKNEKEFSKELYVSLANLKEMFKDGMIIGSHTLKHPWLETLNYEKQKKEIVDSIKFFEKNKILNKNFSVCYPYGSFNSNTIKILEKNKIRFALTTEFNCINSKNMKNIYKLPRYDANDFKNLS